MPPYRAGKGIRLCWNNASGLGGYKWVRPGRDPLYSGLSSAYQVVEANAQDTIKGLERKCCFVVVLSFLCRQVTDQLPGED